MLRYARLLGIQLRASMLLAMQYRADFLIDAAIEVFWAVSAVLPLFVVFRTRPQIAGWSFGEALLVAGWFSVLQGLLEGAINPSLTAVVEHVRKGTLDFVLLKPADAQFLVSTARFQPSRVINLVTALVIFVYAFRLLGRGPTASGLAVSGVLLVAATVLLYSLWIVTVSAAFHVVRIDNLTFLFTAVFDAARWPASVFRGFLHIVFTFVIPLGLMTTYPAEAMLGRLPFATVLASVGGAIGFAIFSRLVWLRSIGKYTSASS